tara:strand:+ start:2076 stop:3827 length:1752 start_codon:yes stop_codon:yes gene_type:complete
MFENLKLRWFLITSVLIFSIWFIYPTYSYYSSNTIDKKELSELQKESINLGLDLRGGLHIVLELDEKSFLQNLALLKGNKSQADYESLLNVAEERSSVNKTNIINELFNVAKIQKIKLNRYFSNLSKSSDNNEIIFQIKNQKKNAMNNILEIMRKRIAEHDQYGLGEPAISQIGDNRLMVELAGITDVARAKEYIQRTAEFELTLVKKYEQHINIIDQINKYIQNSKVDFPPLDSLLFSFGDANFYAYEKDFDRLNNFFDLDDIKDIINKSKSKVVFSNDLLTFRNDDVGVRQIYFTKIKPVISGGMIQNPKASMSEIGTDNAGQWVVNLDMNKEGRKRWSRFTGANIDRRVAIVLDNKVFMAPYIRDKISSGSTQISGFANMQEAKDIASVLQAGELPAPIDIIQTNFVGPSLGEDSIAAGGKSMIMGLVFILFFMIVYYRGAGVIANIALILNLIFVFAVLISMNAVLTLPGIAGLLLTVGMTVDANVIIFERIREELNIGSSPYASVNNGYNRAFETILDANITTLLTAFVLSFIGSGPIKGFATTLSVGIICSMFTAIFVTRTFYLTSFSIRKIKKISI